MLASHFIVRMFSVGLMMLGWDLVSSQDYPIKPIRIVTNEAGGGTDVVARLITQGIASSLSQQLIVENRPSSLYGEIVSNAQPDGYTLLLAGSNLWISPLLLDQVSFDPVRDFAPVTLATNSPQFVVVHPSLPVKTVKELIALAKGKPGQLNYGTGGTGSPFHLAGELFKSMAGVNIARVNYRGGGPAVNALLGGEVQLMFPTSGSVMPHIKSGRLRALAVTTAQPSALAPGLPTVAASGVPSYEAAAAYALFAPAKTPTTLINRLNQEIVRVLNRADVNEKFLTTGIEVVGSTPEQLAAKVKSDIVKWGKVIKDAGIRS